MEGNLFRIPTRSQETGLLGMGLIYRR